MSLLTAYDQQQSQLTYRVLLAALAEPGTLHTLPGTDGAHAGLLTLADYTSPIAAATADTQDAVAELSRVTGAPVTEPDQARLALALSEPTANELRRLNLGTPLAPHTAAVLFQQVPALGSGGEGITLRLTGPGIDSHRTLRVAVERSFVDTRNQQRAYPLGFDIFFITKDGLIAGVPRSTDVEVLR